MQVLLVACCRLLLCNVLQGVQEHCHTASTMTGKRTRRSGQPKPPRRGLLRYTPARAPLPSALLTILDSSKPADTCRVHLVESCMPAESLEPSLFAIGLLHARGLPVPLH